MFILNLCRTLLGILGFSFVSACDGEGASPIPMYGVPAPEYGSPYAEYFVKGKVTDEAGNPIKGIAVTVPDEYADTYEKLKTLRIMMRFLWWNLLYY